jgi:hypothetical protein
LVLPFFAITLFVSAFCLFLVQPIIGKLILPKLGGTPQVWNTCMVFFQMALLAGYAYTHTVSTRLKLRQQLILHGIVLLLPLIFLVPPYGPFNIKGYYPPFGDNPIPSALMLLTMIVGVPFLVVATSAPLLQKWFANTGHPASKDPYFLYGASNLGSLLSLLLYPVAVEPWFGLTAQSWLFAVGYFLLAILVEGCVVFLWKTVKDEPAAAHPVPAAAAPPPVMDPAAPVAPSGAPDAAGITAVTATPPPPAPAPQPAKPAPAPAATSFKKGAPKPGAKPGARVGHAGPDVSIKSDEMTGMRRLRWIFLTAVPSSFMLGVTSHITTDLSPMPLFWLIPLSLYLLSYILVFSKWPVVWVEKPHRVVLYVQAISVALMIFCEAAFGQNPDSRQLWFIVFFNVFAFFATALACHGELAKDRPGTQHLTEYFLLMSVGGMLGGMFNGLVAPVFFKGLYEFPIAIFLACLVRPLMKEEGWLDSFMSNMLEPSHAAKTHAKGQKAVATVQEKPTSYAPILDFALPIIVLVIGFALINIPETPARSGRESNVSAARVFGFGVPLIICCFYYGRNIRFALGIGAVLIVQVIYEYKQEGRGAETLVADRSYFGIIRVKGASQYIETAEGKHEFPYTQLVHGHILHGQNFRLPTDPKDIGNPNRDFSRLATTYYHRRGPAGVVMEKFNWAKDPPNYYRSDTRICASIVGAGSMLDFTLLGALVDGWSEPPYATIGLGTGTMASYGRPFQYVHYYEIDSHVRRLSLPGPKDRTLSATYDGAPIPFFNYLFMAGKRGCNVEVLMGDARLRMAIPYMLMELKTKDGRTIRGELIKEDADKVVLADIYKRDDNNNKVEYAFDRANVVSLKRDKNFAGGPDSFYQMMVVDAFSSDAIPAHLITKEAIEMYFTKLTEDGILCVHTSNRFVNLPKVVAAVATNLGYSYQVGKDSEDRDPAAERDITPLNIGRSGSEWVMVARKSEYLKGLFVPPGYKPPREDEPYWSSRPEGLPRYLWTDDHYDLLWILRALE